MRLAKRISQLEKMRNAEQSQWLKNLSDNELEMLILAISRTIAECSDYSAEDRASATATVVDIEARIAAGLVRRVPVPSAIF